MKNSKGLIAITVVAVLISGCAKTMYVKDGISQAQVNQDNADCQYDVVKNTPTYDGVSDPIAAGWAEAERKKAILSACYTAKGYHLQNKQSDLTEQQQSISDRYKRAADKNNQNMAPIADYIINICRPMDDKGYLECINGKKDEFIASSVFPNITIKGFGARKEIEQQLLRKEINRKEFKDESTKQEEATNKQMIERAESDIKAGVYTGNSKY